mmetsp:Transcript_34816/g.68533  ORF Transcript_34816/g.68533 Transcript_34816/m.68533 type:complete len:114 (+) Transcript_34816:90-431(+)|eukprot:CAMPEP_0194320744 /NCGR_PEP_ID=MMETSP0171-20130528/17015_1 /TAXON_ID=218684 /ORGANISM="Corethron pennatum, Strain L29A3" /LENGTH=113 /DNA_ID=CAMNT_0039078369 /DNA_START=83 /DNA_END=424 /DNA_ORIENTATION=-
MTGIRSGTVTPTDEPSPLMTAETLSAVLGKILENSNKQNNENRKNQDKHFQAMMTSFSNDQGKIISYPATPNVYNQHTSKFVVSNVEQIHARFTNETCFSSRFYFSRGNSSFV